MAGPSIIRSRFKGLWVLIQFSPDDGWCSGFVRKCCYEAGAEAYEVMWEDGEIEPVFVNSIFRIRFKHPKKAKVIDFEARRKGFRVI